MIPESELNFSFEKLSRNELKECFKISKVDFKAFENLEFVNSYATKLSENADFVIGKTGNTIRCLIAYYANTPPLLYISHVYTSKECRRKGYFEQMLEMIIHNEAYQDFTRIRLEVRKDNSPAIAAYVKNKFNIISESETKYKMEREM